MGNRFKLGAAIMLGLGMLLEGSGLARGVPDKGFEALTVNTKAVRLHMQKKYREAIDYYEQALALFRAAYGEEHIYVTTTLNNIGDAWNSLGEHCNALDYYERLLAIDRRVHGNHHRYVASDLNNIGNIWKNLGDYRKASDYLNQALAIRKEVYGETAASTESTRKSLREVQMKLRGANVR